MKKYLLYILLFFAFAAIIDRGFGHVCRHLAADAKGGTTYHYNYIANKTSEDIILMGSSRMCRHYNPQILEDSLGMSVYNTGIKGNGIILNYGLLELIVGRYSPKLIVYDVFAFDMYDDSRFADDNVRYLDNLKDYYDVPAIREIFEDVNPSEKWKLYSQMYRYNSKLPRILGDRFHPTEKYNKGYNPYYGTMDYVKEEDDRNDLGSVDSLKLKYVRKFIELAKEKDITLIFSASPRFGAVPDNRYNDPIKAICREMGVPFIDYYADPEFTSNTEYFHDSNHLNNVGSDVFTRKFIKEIRNNLSI